ncbi:MAG: GNAT family N-acetyltransferase [Thermoleophilia bacterium]
MKFKYDWQPGEFVKHNDELLHTCSDLYSNHYGYWSKENAGLSGKKIRLSAERLVEWLEPEGANIALAYAEDELIGYGIVLRQRMLGGEIISWVTQLVVHEDYRHQGVGKSMLFSFWGMSSDYAWGILSSNPYAVRALEKATRRPCVPKIIKRNKTKLINFGRTHVSYLGIDSEVEITEDVSSCNTQFFTDHSTLNEMIKKASSKTDWRLGPLEEGWEWFAFTFQV